MPNLEFWLMVLMLGSLGLGAWGILWTRTGGHPRQITWGRRLFVAALFLVGAGGLVAAFHRADGLVPLGLAASSLLVGMLWDLPGSAKHDLDLIIRSEEA